MSECVSESVPWLVSECVRVRGVKVESQKSTLKKVRWVHIFRGRGGLQISGV